MGIEICTVGGYNEVGKNCTAIKVDDEVIICDIGLHLEDYIKFTQDEDIVAVSPRKLMEIGAIPDIRAIKKWHKKVKAIIPSHAHLDHVGAVPFLASYFDAPIIGSPFTIAVLKAILRDEKIELRNDIKTLNVGSTLKISDNITIEFVNVTHSTPQTVMIVIHTKYGILIYANDFKFDLNPTLGKKPNFKRLAELGKKGVLCHICESTYATDAIKMPSESIAKEMLREVLLSTDSTGKAIIVTTFSSHIARLKSIIEFGKKLRRKIVFLGRSLSKYTQAAESINIVDFTKDVKIVRFSSKIGKELRKIAKDGKHKYLIVMTGHQGEPKSCLSRLARGDYQFRLSPGDHIVFSCKVIPTPTNQKNRRELEQLLKRSGVRIFTDIHVSGHAGREDLRDLLQLVKPKHLIPAHGHKIMKSALAGLAKEMGFKGNSIHLMNNSEYLLLP